MIGCLAAISTAASLAATITAASIRAAASIAASIAIHRLKKSSVALGCNQHASVAISMCLHSQRPPKAAVAEHAALAAALADSESASSPRPALTAPIQDAYIMRIQHDPTAALSGLLAQKQSLCRRRVTVLKNIVK